MMEYKGYIGRVELDEEAEIFHGEVINTRDVITFQGGSVAELKQVFHDSVDDYLNWCAERGEEPEKPYSGKFVVRISPDLHRDLSIEASRQRISLNALITKKLEAQRGVGLSSCDLPKALNRIWRQCARPLNYPGATVRPRARPTASRPSNARCSAVLASMCSAPGRAVPQQNRTRPTQTHR